MTFLGGILYLFFCAAIVVALWGVHPLIGVVAGVWIIALLWFSRYSNGVGFRRPGPIYSYRACDNLERDRWA